MTAMRGVAVGAILVFLVFVIGGPVLGVVVGSVTFLVPAILILAVLGLAVWKVAEFVRR